MGVLLVPRRLKISELAPRILLKLDRVYIPIEPCVPSPMTRELPPPGAWWTLTEVRSPPSAPMLFSDLEAVAAPKAPLPPTSPCMGAALAGGGGSSLPQPREKELAPPGAWCTLTEVVGLSSLL